MKENAFLVCFATLIPIYQPLTCPEFETADFVDFTKHLNGKAKDQQKQRIHDGILGGTEIYDPTWYPWMASLHVLITEDQKVYQCPAMTLKEKEWSSKCEPGDATNITVFRHFCGASIINHKWLLTARHCLRDYSEPTCKKVGILIYRYVLSNSTKEIKLTVKSKPKDWQCYQLNAKSNIIILLGITSVGGVTYEEALDFVQFKKEPSTTKGFWSRVKDVKIRYSFAKSRNDNFYDFLETAAHDSALIKMVKWVDFSDTVRPILLPSDVSIIQNTSKLLITGWGHYKARDDINNLGDDDPLSNILRAGFENKCSDRMLKHTVQFEDSFKRLDSSTRSKVLNAIEQVVSKIDSNGKIDSADLDKLKELNFSISSGPNEKESQKKYSDKIVCTHADKGQQTTCPGDSGSSITGETNSGKAVILGTSSLGIGPCTSFPLGLIFKNLLGEQYEDSKFSYFTSAIEPSSLEWIKYTSQDGNCKQMATKKAIKTVHAMFNQREQTIAKHNDAAANTICPIILSIVVLVLYSKLPEI